jgi:transposase
VRPKGSKQKLEQRRRTAVGIAKKKGLSIREVAAVIGCAPASVSRWNTAYKRGGAHGLDSKPQGGSRPRLSQRQRTKLRRILIRGARAWGFPTELWTLKRVQQVVKAEFGVDYHIGHLHRIVKALGFSPQKPAKRAREQDEEAVKAFREKDWPRIKKKPAEGGEPSSSSTRAGSCSSPSSAERGHSVGRHRSTRPGNGTTASPRSRR